MKTTKTNKNNEIQIGDKVKFVVGTSLLTGVVTKFYKNSYGDEECSVKTELKSSSGKINQKIFPHILLHRVSKIEGKDEVEAVREMRQQIVELEQENKQLREQNERVLEKLDLLIRSNQDLERENEKLASALVEEPDKDELYELKQDFDILYNKTKERDASIRKQVCNEIREFIDNNDHSEENEARQSSESVIYARQLYEFLDQIEQAKENRCESL